MKKKIIFIGALLTGVLFTGCANEMARHYGGTMKVTLPANQKLTQATWKDSQLWYLTRPMRPDEEAEVSTFQEQNSLGIMEGTVIFYETKTK